MDEALSAMLLCLFADGAWPLFARACHTFASAGPPGCTSPLPASRSAPPVLGTSARLPQLHQSLVAPTVLRGPAGLEHQSPQALGASTARVPRDNSVDPKILIKFFK